MRALLPCRACGRHVFADESECPFCKVATKRSATASGVLFGSAMMVAASACSGSLEGAGIDASTEAAVSHQDSATANPGSADGAMADDISMADSASADDVAVDGAPDVETIDVRKLPSLDATDTVDADDSDVDARSFPVLLYRSPPRRSNWS